MNLENCKICTKKKRDCDLFTCVHCGVNTLHINEYYMIHDEVWLAARPPLENSRRPVMACIGCVETRLGRLLTPEDFTDAPANKGFFIQSPRLLSRLYGVEYV